MNKPFSPTHADYLYRWHLHEVRAVARTEDFGLFKGLGSAFAIYAVIALVVYLITKL